MRGRCSCACPCLSFVMRLDILQDTSRTYFTRSSPMARHWQWALASLITLSGLDAARAELPPLIPRDILFGNPEKTAPQLSPDGKHLAYLAPDKKDVLQVWVRTVGAKDDRMLTADKKRGIRSYFWTYDPDQLLYMQDADGDENFHLYAVNIKSGDVRDLTPYKGVRV